MACQLYTRSSRGDWCLGCGEPQEKHTPTHADAVRESMGAAVERLAMMLFEIWAGDFDEAEAEYHSALSWACRGMYWAKRHVEANRIDADWHDRRDRRNGRLTP